MIIEINAKLWKTENFYSDVMSLKYCKICEEDFDRMRLGYNPHNEDCGRWQCHLLDCLNFLGIFIIGIIILIPLLIVLLFFAIYNAIEGKNYAVQEQRNEEVIHDRLERKKQRKPSMVSHSMARSKSRQKK